MKKKSTITIFTFCLFLSLIIAFYLWSHNLFISLILVFILYILTFNKVFSFLSKNINFKIVQIIKYTFYSILPLFFLIFIRVFFVDVYFVPTESMENTLHPRDYILINKFYYGTKVPKYTRDIPIIGKLLTTNGEGHKYDLFDTLKAFKNYKREDIVVFKSVSSNDAYMVKRIIGLPGDTIDIESSKVFINKTLETEKKEYCYNYKSIRKGNLGEIKIISNEDFNALDNIERELLSKDIRVEPHTQFFLFPYTKQNEWTFDNYGPLIIPKKGMSIMLDKNSFDIYKYIIKNYENESLEFSNTKIINYKFKNDYYFMMGDNRHHSRDSRSFGFVPESYIQGKMFYKLFSK